MSAANRDATKALPAGFLAKTRKTDCTVWIGSTNNKGYGQLVINGKALLAHRVAYEAEFGPIPKGHVIDHLCRVRNCVNPLHLEAVTPSQNARRGRSATRLQVGDVCVNGHPLVSDDLIYTRPNGHTTECRICLRAARVAARDGKGRPSVQRYAARVADELAQVEAASP